MAVRDLRHRFLNLLAGRTEGAFLDGARRGERRRGPSVPQRLVAGAALLAFFVLLVGTAWVCDDAYITFRVIDNALHGHGLRWNVAERVQAFTHPLWLAALLPVHAVTGEPYFSTLAVSCAFSLAGLWLLLTRVASTPRAAVVGAAGLLGSKSFVEYSTSGLENPLVNLWLVSFMLIQAVPARTLRLIASSWVAGLLMTTRLDAGLLVLPAVCLLLAEEWRVPRRWLWASTGLLPLLAWEVFSLVYYGVPFPNTAYAKLNTGVPLDERALQGAWYLVESARLDPVGMVAILAGCAFGLRRARAFVGGVVLWLGYVVWIGGDFMLVRMIGPAVVMSICVLVRFEWGRRWRWAGILAVVIAGLSLASPSPVLTQLGANRRVGGSALITQHHMTDERLFYYPTTGLLAARGASLVCQHTWVNDARDAVTNTGCFLPPLAIQNQNGCEGRLPTQQPPPHRPPYRAVEALSIGFVGYCLGPEIHVIDLHALSDPLLSRLPGHPRWAPGHLPRTMPGGYLATLEFGEPRLSNPVVAEYYRRLSVLTRAPLTEPGRFTEILSFLKTSTNTELVERLRPVYSWTTVSRRIEDGAAWNDPRATILTFDGGLSVEYPDGTRGSKLEVSVSGNDRYRFEFYNGTSLVGSFVIAPITPWSGDIKTTVHGLPRQTFDRVVVIGRRGDFRYSLGHLRVLG